MEGKNAEFPTSTLGFPHPHLLYAQLFPNPDSQNTSMKADGTAWSIEHHTLKEVFNFPSQGLFKVFEPREWYWQEKAKSKTPTLLNPVKQSNLCLPVNSIDKL